MGVATIAAPHTWQASQTSHWLGIRSVGDRINLLGGNHTIIDPMRIEMFVSSSIQYKFISRFGTLWLVVQIEKWGNLLSYKSQYG